MAEGAMIDIVGVPRGGVFRDFVAPCGLEVDALIVDAIIEVVEPAAAADGRDQFIAVRR